MSLWHEIVTHFFDLELRGKLGIDEFCAFWLKRGMHAPEAGQFLSSALIVAAMLWLVGCEDLSRSAEDTSPPVEQSQPALPTVINVNTAAQEELEDLPSIGKILAERIIDGRPYGHVNDLLEVDGLGEGKLSRIRSLVRVYDEDSR